MSTISRHSSLRLSTGWRKESGTRAATNSDLCTIMKSLLETHADDQSVLGARQTSPEAENLMSCLENKCEASGLLGRSGGSIVQLLSQLSQSGSVYADRIIERRNEGRHAALRIEDTPSTGLRLISNETPSSSGIAPDVSLRTGDRLYDLALLLTTLLEDGQRSHANIAMNTYFDATREADQDLGVLSFFMAARSLDRAADANASGDTQTSDARIQLARSLIVKKKPAVTAICVASSPPSSLIGLRIASELSGPCGARRLSAASILNELRQTVWSGPLASAGQEPAGRATVYRLLAQRTLSAVAANCSVVCEAPFVEAPARSLIEAAARGGPFAGVWLGGRPDQHNMWRSDSNGAGASLTPHRTEARCNQEALDGWLELNHLTDDDVQKATGAVLRHIETQRRAWENTLPRGDLSLAGSRSGCVTVLPFKS